MLVPSQYFTTGDIAKMCDVTANGVIKWIKAGKLKAFKTPGGQRRVREEDFRDFIDRFNYPINPKYFKDNRQRRILIVDDDRDQVRLLKSYLTRENQFDVLSAHNGYEGCIKAGSYRPDLILLDIMMPKIDGYEVLRQIQSAPETQNTQVIVLTALTADVVSPRLPQNMPLMTKPVDFQRLLATIEMLIPA